MVYLTMTAGSRAGTNYLLDATDENRIGRGQDCLVVVDDPLCSRVHAAIVQEDGSWSVWDAKRSQRHFSQRDSRRGLALEGRRSLARWVD